MTTKTTINIKNDQRDALLEKYPNITFTRLVEMGLEALLDTKSKETQSSSPHMGGEWNTLVADYNKLKTSYREFKDEVDNRLITLETRLK
jgi:hypothetical protein